MTDASILLRQRGRQLRLALLFGMKRPLVGFKFGDQEPDPFKDLLVKHVQRHLSIVCDPLVQLVALITYPPTPNEH